MKNVVRAFVVVLALTGAAASTRIATAAPQAQLTAAKSSFMPMPTCDPNDPNACNIDGKTPANPPPTNY